MAPDARGWIDLEPVRLSVGLTPTVGAATSGWRVTTRRRGKSWGITQR